MDESSLPQNQNEAKRESDVPENGRGCDEATPPNAPVVDRDHSAGAYAPHETAGPNRTEEVKTPEKWWNGILYDMKATDILVAIFTAILTVNSCTQNSLMNSGNTISNDAAQASKDAAVAAQNTFALERSGEESAKQALDATKSTAEATKATADGVAKTADSIAAAIDMTKQTKPPRKQHSLQPNLPARQERRTSNLWRPIASLSKRQTRQARRQAGLPSRVKSNCEPTFLLKVDRCDSTKQSSRLLFPWQSAITVSVSRTMWSSLETSFASLKVRQFLLESATFLLPA
jgi:hypothetical protein